MGKELCALMPVFVDGYLYGEGLDMEALQRGKPT